jgi:hypothetical protein
MAILNNSNAISSGGYDINNSLRFRSSASAYLNRTFATPTSQSIFTFSCWIKRGKLSTGQTLFGVSTTGFDGIYFDTTDQIIIYGNGAPKITTTAVYRDPSAWYHIVLSHSGTSNTLYVNGVSVGTATSALNIFNTANSHIIGQNSSANYYDGYLAELNFIDGQALTPSSFGETDTTTGSWKPKAYSGTYGTNGFYLPFRLNNTSSFQANYTSSSQYLSVASNAAFGYGTGNFTVEGWHYATSSGTSYLFDQRTTDPQLVPSLYINGGSYTVYVNGGSVLTAGTVVTNQWVHWALVRASGTTKLYINGISVGSFADTNNYINSPFIIGNYYGATFGWAGYLSNVRVVKGTAVYTSNFTPSSTPLIAISGTSLLTLQNTTIVDNSTNAFTITNSGSITTSTATPFVANITSDISGNSNNWTGNNIQVATATATTYDAMTDVPTNTSATVANYAVLNLLKQGSAVTVSNGNLRAVGTGAAWGTVLSSIGMTSGKWYCEITVTANSNSQMFGICQETATLTTYVGASAVGYGYYAGGEKYNNGVNALYGASYTANDVIGIAYDADIGSLTFYKNGSSQGVAYSGLSTTATWFFAVSAYNTTNTNDINFGQRPFTYTPPTGFVRLNTYNLPDSTIKKGNSYMDVALRTGTGTADGQSQVISSLAFTPDLVWNKARSNAFNHNLVDSVRGNDTILFSNLTNAETSVGTTGTQLQITTNGFTAIQRTSYQAVNQNGVTYVNWMWLAGAGSTSSGTGTGGITSVTQSVNTTAGFSIVTYTGSGSNGTVTHGLGVAPKWVIVKARTQGTGYNWVVYHASLGATQYLGLNLTNAAATASTVWNNTTPTSSVFSLGNDPAINGNTLPFVAYCWAEIAGFSKFGSYTGNASTDGPFVYLGFRPKFVLIKRTDSTSNWYLFDTARDTYNVMKNELLPNSTNAEADNTRWIDTLSNGFKIRNDNASQINASGATMVYMAFAENPFKNANAR